MAFVHDLAESIVGDIVPSDPNVTLAEKHELEKAAMLKLGEILGNPVGRFSSMSLLKFGVAKEFYDLWVEYEECVTPEAKIVKQLDKFEMIFQANEYEMSQENQDLQVGPETPPVTNRISLTAL